MFTALLLTAAAPPADRLPRATPIPYADADTAQVMAPVSGLFAALAAGDAAGVLAVVDPDGRVTATGTRATSSGLRRESWREFAARVTPATAFDERISDPAVEVDGDIAMVWAPYVVRVGGKVANCGIDHFDLVRDRVAGGGGWKAMNLSFSSRISGCGE